ncbi:MAG: glycosyltransferase [Schleiferiaceae bacterium]|jgi:glycosyltransferase involved in cell wall biosynthesis|nr:glycosyltransferase [Schleiferiaceae bacterium]
MSKASKAPLVSVIVPNYNHAPYLKERIDSILNQTFQDFEVLLLDDCSTDHSRDILNAYAEKEERIRTHFNTENTGSTFAQWNKGVSLARGKYVWIAESDDSCDVTLLEKLVTQLEADENVGIAFAQSYIVDEQSEIINSFNENYKFIYKSDRWERDFKIKGTEECAHYLIFSNTIPNASGALMRKSVYEACGGAETNWKLNGDWFFYVKMLLISDLSYLSEHLNFFRFHQQTQRQNARADHVVYDEIIKTLHYIEEHTEVIPEEINRSWREIAGWWGGSLYHQKFTKDFVKHNWRLYKFFRTKRPRILLNVISNSIFIFIGQILEFLGIKKAVKSLRAKMFPGKYFDY